jgi:hypothetical protein
MRWQTPSRKGLRNYGAKIPIHLDNPSERSDALDSFQRTCKNCGKTSRVDVFTVYGFKEHEDADCPVCGNVIASAMCFNIRARVIKAF